MKNLIAILIAIAPLTGALAEEPADSKSEKAGQIDPKATPAQLPESASDQARKALSEIAFGKQGELMRAAHSKATDHATQAQEDATAKVTDAAAIAAAKRAETESRSAAAA
jgi:hypothetical protein